MIQELPFLPQGEILMAGVKLSPDLPAARRVQVERLTTKYAFRRRISSTRTTSHVGAYRWSHTANAAIGQVAYYLQVIEDDRRAIAERLEQRLKLKFRVIRPRGFVIMGRTEEFDEYKLDALRRLNSTLSRIEVLSYTDLIGRGQSLISIFEEDLE